MGPESPLTIVVPVYGYTTLMKRLKERLDSALLELRPNYRLLVVEDGGTEDSWQRCRDLAESHSQVSALRLPPGSGQHSCILGGLRQASTGWVVVMDGDLQDPPELIPALLERAEQGFEVVMTARLDTGQSWFRNLLGKLYMSLLLGRWNPPRYSCFSALSPEIVKFYLQHPHRGKLYVPILLETRLPKALVSFERPRTESSSYSIKRLLQLALRNFHIRYFSKKLEPKEALPLEFIE